MSVNAYFSVDVYPYETTEDVLEEGFSFKTVHFLCQGQAEHEVDQKFNSMKNFDSVLTDRGKEQCRFVAKRIAKCRIGTIHHDMYTRVDMLVTSPLSRCISTVLRSSKPILAARPKTPVIAHEYLREPVNYICDRRQPVTALAAKFSVVQFDLVPNFDSLWRDYEKKLGSVEEYSQLRESAEIYKVAERARSFLKWLGTRPETHIVLCSHKNFLHVLMNFGYSENFLVDQDLDDRQNKENAPLLNFKGGGDEFMPTMRADFDHCEMRSVRLSFRTTGM